MRELATCVGGPDPFSEIQIGEPPHVGQELTRSEGRTGRRVHIWKHDGTFDEDGRWIFRYEGVRELPALKLPEICWFTWRGHRIDVRRFTNADEYPFDCPACGGHFVVAPGGGRNHDRVDVDPHGRLTVSPSIRCPSGGCSWHVHITAGEAHDQ